MFTDSWRLTIGFGTTEATTTGSTGAIAATVFLLLGELGREVALAINFATANPHFHAYYADFCVRLNESIINVGTECVQRRAALDRKSVV